jgi:hypothetical protein
MLAKAIKIASEAHLEQVDKGGNPYILHPLWVMDRVRHLGEDYMIVAVLHDVPEDSNWTIEMLRKEGFSSDILMALALLDFRNVDYDARIKEIGTGSSRWHFLAKAIKQRDLEHNSKITRLKGLRKKDFDRLEKYHKAYTYLNDL